jgi:hypothetical protein
MSRALHPASSTRATVASATGTPAFAARHAARVPMSSRACLNPSRRVGFASLGSRLDARKTPRRAASEDPESDVEAMVDVDAIRAMLESDPAVRAQEERIASEARNAASLQVDKQMAEASDAIRSELSRRGSAASDELAKTQEAALAELEAKSQAVLRAEAKMREIAAEREALEAEAKTSGGGENVVKKKWGASVGDVDENAERVESAKAAACSAIFGTALSAPLLLSQSPGGFVTAESLGGVFVSTALFGVVYRYAARDDFGNDQLKFGVLGAFGLTRGLGEADVYLHGSDATSFSSWAEAALLAGESVLTFAFAYAALEYGFKNDYLKPFPMSRNAPRDDD